MSDADSFENPTISTGGIVNDGAAGYPVSGNKLVRQAALGSPREGTTDSRWDNRTIEIGHVCRVLHKTRLARVRLINNPKLEMTEVPWVSNMSVSIGDRVYIQWIGGHANNPIIVGLANRDSRERSQSTKRPMTDIVPPPDDPDGGRHVIEYPLHAAPHSDETPITDLYSDKVSWETYGPDGRYIQVLGQEMPKPVGSYGGTPKEFARLYHQLDVSPEDGTVTRQIPTSDGASAWRITAELGDGSNFIVVSFEFGAYGGGVQDWSGNGLPFKVTIQPDGNVSVESAGSLTINAQRISLRGGNRPILVEGNVAVPEVTA